MAKRNSIHHMTELQHPCCSHILQQLLHCLHNMQLSLFENVKLSYYGSYLKRDSLTKTFMHVFILHTMTWTHCKKKKKTYFVLHRGNKVIRVWNDIRVGENNDKMLIFKLSIWLIKEQLLALRNQQCPHISTSFWNASSERAWKGSAEMHCYILSFRFKIHTRWE